MIELGVLKEAGVKKEGSGKGASRGGERHAAAGRNATG